MFRRQSCRLVASWSPSRGLRRSRHCWESRLASAADVTRNARAHGNATARLEDARSRGFSKSPTTAGRAGTGSQSSTDEIRSCAPQGRFPSAGGPRMGMLALPQPATGMRHGRSHARRPAIRHFRRRGGSLTATPRFQTVGTVAMDRVPRSAVHCWRARVSASRRRGRSEPQDRLGGAGTADARPMSRRSKQLLHR